MASNYDHTTWFYDALARLVYGKSIVKAQTIFLPFIPANARVLIVGGGTGWILEEIAQNHPTGLTIFYVEISEKMIARSMKRDYGKNEVSFHCQPVEEFNAPDIDVVITPFLFDNHDRRDAELIFNHIAQMLKPDALWLNTDFQLTGKWWQKLMLKSMLLFFRLFGAVNNSATTNMQPVFENAGYKKIATRTFYGDFIRSDVWQKPV